MTHDPICPNVKHPDGCLCCEIGAPCIYCELIAKVREETFATSVQRVEALVESRTASVEWTRDYEADETGNTRNPRVWIREATAAIKGEAMTHDPLCEWSTPCIHGENQKHSRDTENPSVPDASYCWMCGADCECALIDRVIAAAVQRVEALDWSILYESERNPLREAIAAIKGDSDD